MNEIGPELVGVERLNVLEVHFRRSSGSRRTRKISMAESGGDWIRISAQFLVQEPQFVYIEVSQGN